MVKDAMPRMVWYLRLVGRKVGKLKKVIGYKAEIAPTGLQVHLQTTSIYPPPNTHVIMND